MAGGKNKNTRVVAVLMLLVVGVVFSIVPISNGRTGLQVVQAWWAASPTSAPPAKSTVVVPHGAPASYYQEITSEGRPRVDDNARTAQPLDDLTDRDRDALDKLILDSRKH